MNILAPIILFVTWLAIVIAPLYSYALEDLKNGVPKDQRRGVSIFPGFPFMPLMFWGLAWLIDLWISAWGTRVIALGHAAIFIFAVFMIVRNIMRIRKIPDVE